MRQSLVAGNWKMHGSQASVEALLGGLLEGLAGEPAAEVAVCPTYVHLAQALTLGMGSDTQDG